jgi:hypothetical protein
MGPDERNDATGPASALAGADRMEEWITFQR